MNRAAMAALLGHWRRNPLQLFTLVAGLALATALWSGVQAINAEARASYDAAAAALGEGRFTQLVARDGGAIPQELYVTLRRAGWLVSPVVEGRLNGLRIIGLEPLTAPGELMIDPRAGGEIQALLSGRGQIFGRAQALAALPPLGPEGPEPVADPDLAPGTVLTDIGIAQRLLDRPGVVDRLIVAPEQSLGRPALEDIAPDLALRPPQKGAEVGRLTDSFHLNLTAFGLLSFAVGLFIVHGAIGLAFEQRRAMTRTLRALGLPLGRLIALTVIELLLLSIIAGALGVVLGYFVAAALLPDVAATLRGLYGAQVSGTLELRPAWWLSGLAIAVGGTLLAASGALWRLARAPLLAAGQARAWAMAARRGRLWQGMVAGALLLAALALGLWGEGLGAGFVLLGCLLIGGALALPLLLDMVLGLGARRARAVVPQWFWADTRQQLPGLSLALMALLLAMAANVGVSTMVSSFRLTFEDFLDQRLAAELYVTAADRDEAAMLLAYLEPRVEAVLPVQSTERRLAGQPAALFGYRDDVSYRDNWTFLAALSDPWDRIAAGRGVLISEQLARRAGLAPGDLLSVAPDRELPVVGIYSDYGNPQGEAIIGEALFRTLFPEIQPLQFRLRLSEDKVPALIQDLEGAGFRPDAVVDQAMIKALSLSIFERTFAVTAALNILTLAVAGFAILMSLLTLAALRVPQLAPVWALGLRRADLGWLELVRAVLLAVLTALAALPLGLGLAWVLLAIINVEAFGWRLPMFLFPWDYARLGLFALLAALVAALWPARRLARTPPAELLKVFSNER